MDKLAELLRQGADKLVNLPTEAQRFVTNPQAFIQLLTGKNALPRETGFAAGATGLPAQQGTVLDPNYQSYMQGYEQGEPVSYAAMAAPAAVPVAKALAPKAGQMAEQYMVNQGFMPAVVPTNRKKIIEEQISKIAPEEYRGSHTAPNAQVYGGTLDDLAKIMPADVYSSKGIRLYGIGDPRIDQEWFKAAYLSKGQPDRMVEVYRAVPKGVKDINAGDWVTTSKTYAKNHGENTLNGEYEIISKKVKAKTLSSEGYPYEFGYNE